MPPTILRCCAITGSTCSKNGQHLILATHLATLLHSLFAEPFIFALLNAAEMVFEKEEAAKTPQEGYRQSHFLHSLVNIMNRLLDQRALSRSETMSMHASQSCSSMSQVSPKAEPNNATSDDSATADGDRSAKSRQRFRLTHPSLPSSGYASLNMPGDSCGRHARDSNQRSEGTDAAVACRVLDEEYILHQGALHELLPSWPTPSEAAFADIQAVAAQCLLTLDWVHEEEQMNLAQRDCPASTQANASAQSRGLRNELFIVLHKLVLGHLQNEQLDMHSLVLVGWHAITIAAFYFPACTTKMNELCCAFALRFATDKRVLGVRRRTYTATFPQAKQASKLRGQCLVSWC